MDIKEYNERSKETAQYPIPVLGDMEIAYVYPALGLCSEVLELIQAIKLGETEDIIVKECGDVLWYCNAIIREFRLDIDLIVKQLNSFSSVESSCEFWSDDLLKAMQKITSHLKKSILGNNGELFDKYHDDIETSISAIYSIVSFVCKEFNSSIEDCHERNLNKLLSRKERNVIVGDGDNR